MSHALRGSTIRGRDQAYVNIDNPLCLGLVVIEGCMSCVGESILVYVFRVSDLADIQVIGLRVVGFLFLGCMTLYRCLLIGLVI